LVRDVNEPGHVAGVLSEVAELCDHGPLLAEVVEGIFADGRDGQRLGHLRHGIQNS